ncbi:hypothetical protein AVEN_162540-1, partial [Araneus ventricosus]
AINVASYCVTLTKLKSVIRCKRPGLLNRGAEFLEDNARPHTERDKKVHILHLRWRRLGHPAYSPDLAPSDFHLCLH